MIITIWLPFKLVNKNRLEYFYQAIESVINQTNWNWELILSNDNSPLDIDLKKYSKNPKIKYFKHDKNLWLFNNFNFCLNKASWDFFIPLWDDDLLDENFIFYILEYINNNKDLDLILSNFNLINSKWTVFAKSNLLSVKEKKWEITLNNYITKFFLWEEIPLFLCWVVRTQKFKSLWWYPDYWMPTDLYLIYFFLLNFSFWICKKNLFSIRRHNHNLSWIRKIDIMRFETVKVNKIIENDFFKVLNKKNRDKFNNNKQKLHNDHVNLLIKFKFGWRFLWLIEFFKKPFTFRNIIVFLIWLVFWKNTHNVLIFLNDQYYNFRNIISK